jgi:hypothetical protein
MVVVIEESAKDVFLPFLHPPVGRLFLIGVGDGSILEGLRGERYSLTSRLFLPGERPTDKTASLTYNRDQIESAALQETYSGERSWDNLTRVNVSLNDRGLDDLLFNSGRVYFEEGYPFEIGVVQDMSS